jgi:hypothetical protein
LLDLAGTTVPAASSPSITIGGITNPPSSGTTGAYGLDTATSAGSVIDHGNAPGTTIT